MVDTSHLDEYKFKKGQSGNLRGRPKKIFTILKKQGFSTDDIKSTFLELGWYKRSQLKELENDGDTPMIIRIVAKQFLSAYNRSDWTKIREIMQHTIGMPTQEFKSSDIVPIAVKLIKPEEELDSENE